MAVKHANGGSGARIDSGGLARGANGGSAVCGGNGDAQAHRHGGNGAPDIDLDSIIRAYHRYAPVYDVLFGPVFQRGRAMSAKRANGCEGVRVLEVGVGSGLSLPLYDRDKTIVGIDVSGDMLALARRRVEARRLDNVVQLAQMDAEELAFQDGAFDIVVASHVMSVVPDPQRCLSEMERVCAPGGTILICNHFASGLQRRITRRLEPLAKWLGWRPDFCLTEMLDGSPLQVVTTDPVPPFGLFSLAEARKV